MFDTYEAYLDFLRGMEVDIEELRNPQSNWKSALGEELGEKYEVLKLPMPNTLNAKHAEWKIVFEKYVPQFDDEVMLIGHSLGGTFLAKYLAEEDFPKKILATFLVAPVYDAEGDTTYSMTDFALPDALDKLNKQGGAIYIYASEDDPVVPYANAEKFKVALPHAILRTLSDRGHFNQETLPELVEGVKNI